MKKKLMILLVVLFCSVIVNAKGDTTDESIKTLNKRVSKLEEQVTILLKDTYETTAQFGYYDARIKKSDAFIEYLVAKLDKHTVEAEEACAKYSKLEDKENSALDFLHKLALIDNDTTKTQYEKLLLIIQAVDNNK